MGMKILYISLYVLGFTFEATIPVIILSSVVPFTKDSAGKAVTFIGILAGLWLLYQAYKRLKKRITEWKRGLARASVLAAFKLVPIILITVVCKWIPTVVESAAIYWYRVFPIMIVGIILTVIAEVVEREAKGE
ncbi:MAG: hypothetical protein IKL79_01330 [Clostridia bacterium]|nr:hypothetical protein [Clostridia bacterium]